MFRYAGNPRQSGFRLFGGGPRICICIGASFAMAEAQLILATIPQQMRRFIATAPTARAPSVWNFEE